jgi:hypothetical protein
MGLFASLRDRIDYYDPLEETKEIRVSALTVRTSESMFGSPRIESRASRSPPLGSFRGARIDHLPQEVSQRRPSGMALQVSPALASIPNSCAETRLLVAGDVNRWEWRPRHSS